MVKANELRIGNLVTINNAESWPKLSGKKMIVVAINYNSDLKYYPTSTHHISIFDDTTKREYSQYIEFIEPIPLTEEWFDENGKKDEEGKFSYVPFNDYLRIYPLINGGIVVCNGIHTPISRYEHIKYVHLLQNFVHANTGKELELKKGVQNG